MKNDQDYTKIAEGLGINLDGLKTQSGIAKELDMAAAYKGVRAFFETIIPAGSVSANDTIHIKNGVLTIIKAK